MKGGDERDAPAEPSTGRGLWLTPASPYPASRGGWRGFFTSERLIIYLIVPAGMVVMMGLPYPLRLGRLLTQYLFMVTAMSIIGGLFELSYRLWARAIVTPAARWRRIAGHVVTWLAISIGGTYLASWILAALWSLSAARLQEQSLLPGLVIGGCVIAVMVAADERRARGLALERLAAAARVAALRSELSALQARTDPHFLFNSLNAVAGLIPDDPAGAEKMLERLADVFRYALEAGKQPLASLAQELSAVRTYVAVEEVRFGERLRFALEVESEVEAGGDEVMLPPLSLQPLVENAVRHGVSTRIAATKIEMSVRRSGEEMVIVVEDQPELAGEDFEDEDPSETPNPNPNPTPTPTPIPIPIPTPTPIPIPIPIPIPSVSSGSGTALANLRTRLALLYGARASLSFGPARPAGWRVELRIPRTALVPSPASASEAS